IILSKLNSLKFRIHAPRPGALYLADSFHSGWSAKVNGRPAKILPANYAFRAVPIPAGDVHVEFCYLPNGFAAGLLVSVLSSATSLALAIGRPRRTSIKSA